MDYRVVAGIVLFLVVVSGCAGSDAPDLSGNDGRMEVVVSILPLADFVEKVGGDKVEVVVMVPPLASPESYEPTPGQMKALADARMHVKVGSGVPFEAEWMDEAGEGNVFVVDCSRGIEVVDNDPHVWLSLRNARIMVKNIYEGLADVDPSNKDYYFENYKKYVLEIDMLDREVESMFDGAGSRKFMIFHPSFGYFARDYGLEQVAIEEEGKEPSSADVSRLIEFARGNGIRVVFAQPGGNVKSAEVIADEIGGEIVFVDPLARDYVSNIRIVSKSFTESMK